MINKLLYINNLTSLFDRERVFKNGNQQIPNKS